MAIDVKTLGTQATDLWRKLTPRRRVVAIAAVVGTIAMIWWIAGRRPDVPYATLFSGLTLEDAGEVTTQLGEQKVPYKIEANGTSVAVPASRVHELRIALATAGVPRGGGVGFEVFDKQSFGATSFVEQINFRRALQGELQRTIASLDAVESARVHVAMRERSLYRAEDQPPTASVALKLRRGRTLDASQVRGIVNLVASSIDGLTAEHVTVVDETGKVLSRNEEDGDGDGDRARVALERHLEENVAGMLAPVLGPEHFEVSVSAELDRTQVERTEDVWDKDREAVRTESRTIEGPGSTALQLAAPPAVASLSGGVGEVGAQPATANGPTSQPVAAGPTPGAGAVGGVAGAQAAQGGFGAVPASAATSPLKLAEQRTYEINRTVTKTVGPKVKVRRVRVAILVDGVPVEGDAQKRIPRDKGELARIEAVARQAAGIDAERGDTIEVASVPFVTTAPPAPPTAAPPSWPIGKRTTLIAGGGAGALVLAVIAALFVRSRRRARRTPLLLPGGLPLKIGDFEQHVRAPLAAPGEPATAALPLPGPSARERAIQAARGDAERAAMVLSAWLSEVPAAAPTAAATPAAPASATARGAR